MCYVKEIAEHTKRCKYVQGPVFSLVQFTCLRNARISSLSTIEPVSIVWHCVIMVATICTQNTTPMSLNLPTVSCFFSLLFSPRVFPRVFLLAFLSSKVPDG